jgi:hypothetical protein
MQMQKLLSVVVIAALAGCADAASPGDLAISITTSASQIRSGDSISVNVTVTNVGDREHTIEGSGCPRLFRVYELEGDVVPRPELCSLSSKPVRLVRGDSYTLSYRWVAENFTYTDGTVVRTPLPAGPYTFRGQVYSGEFGPISAGTTSIYVF